MNKNLLYFWLTLLGFVCALPVFPYGNIAIDGIMYEVDDYPTNAAKVVSYYNENGESIPYKGDILIPSEITYRNETYPVSAIGRYAFSGCKLLNSVTLPHNIQTIEYRAFYNCTALSSIDLPSSVTKIESNAFEGCSSLTSLRMPEGLTTIESYSFSNCSSLASIVIPDGITTIKSYAFQNCSALTALNIPQSVTSISAYAFYNCSSLSSIQVNSLNSSYDSRNNCNAIIEKTNSTLILGCSKTIIPNTVTSIGAGAFSNCTSLTTISIPSSVTSIGASAFSDCSSLTTINIPSSVTSIDNYAFSNDKQLRSVLLEEGLEYLGNNVFEECEKIKYITLPSSIKNIGYSTFSHCYQLESIDIIGNPYYISEEGILYNREKTKVIVYPEGCPNQTFTIPTTITDFTTYIKSPHLKYVNIHEQVNQLNIKSFAFCPNLMAYRVTGNHQKFYTVDGVLYMKDTDHYGNFCEQLFAFPSGKTSLSIPSSVKYVWGETLRNAVHLTDLHIADGNEPIYFNFYKSNDKPNNTYPNTQTLYFPESPLQHIYIGRNCLLDTHYGLFSGLNTIQSATIGKEVSDIGSFCFLNCSQLTQVKIEAPIKVWGENAFFNTPWQNEIAFEDSLKYFQNIPIEMDPDLKYVHLKEGTTLAAKGLFKGSGIVSIDFPNNMTVIPNEICSECKSLSKVHFGNQTKIIGDDAFEHSGIKNVKIPNSVQRINHGAFFATSLDTLIIPNSVTFIDVYGIAGTKVLILEDGDTPLKVPNNNADDGYFTAPFQNAKEIYIGRNMTSDGWGHAGDPFGGNSSVQELTIGPKVNDWHCRTVIGSQLRKVNLLAKKPINPNFGYDSNASLSVPYGTLETYSTSNFWNNFSTIQAVDHIVLNKDQEVMTFSSPYDLDFSSVQGLEVYLIKGYQSETNVLTWEKVTKVPAGTGVIIKGAKGNYNIPCVLLTENIQSPLKGVYPSKTLSSSEDNEYVFTMKYKDQCILFERVDDCGIVLSKNDAYLTLPMNLISPSTRVIEVPIDKKILLVDNGTPYTNSDAQYYNTVEYQRNFSNTKWQALYIPFSMNYEDWQDRFDIAYLNDVHQFDDNDDGVIDRTQLEIIRVTQGAIEANTPYLIRAKEVGNHTLCRENTILQRASSESISCSSTRTLYTFYGTYSGISGEEMFNNGYYAMGGGSLFYPNSSQYGLKGYRWYLAVTDKNGNKMAAPKRIEVIEKGHETTGINEVREVEKFYNIYDINGRLVRKNAKDYHGLKHGVYIVNGKKVVL